jgi:hypothetical protein
MQHGADRPRFARQVPARPFGHRQPCSQPRRWRTGSGGKPLSTRCAAVSTMRGALHDGHSPRPSHEKAIGVWCQ